MAIRPAFRCLVLLVVLTAAACASDRTPWDSYARETGRIVQGKP